MTIRFGFSLQGRGALADCEALGSGLPLGRPRHLRGRRRLVAGGVRGRGRAVRGARRADDGEPADHEGDLDQAPRQLRGPLLAHPRSGGGRPHPVQQPHIPIWIGGHSEAALKRVVAIADGWHPLGLRPPVTLDPPEMAQAVRRLRDLASAAGRDPRSITITFKGPLKHFVLDFWVLTVPEMLGVLEQVAADVRPRVRG